VRTFDKYERRGAYHWEEFGRPTPYRRHALTVQKWITEQNVLDAGAGDGLITSLLDATGIDTNELAVRLAKAKGVDVTLGDIYEVVGDYDAVYLGDVLEHLEEPGRALEHLHSVTEVLYISTPPRKGDTLRPYHVQEWTPEELVVFLMAYGWDLDGRIETANDRMYGRFVCESC